MQTTLSPTVSTSNFRKIHAALPEGHTESAAMWKLYSKTNEAVAIESDYSLLAGLLPDAIYLGLIDYIDYETQWLPEFNTFYPFVHKRKSFEHEREVRALVSDMKHYIPSGEYESVPDRAPTPERPTGIRLIDKHPPNANHGLHIPVDVAKLVKCLHVAPFTPPWFEDLVRQTTRQFGFEFEVKRSRLDGKPSY